MDLDRGLFNQPENGTTMRLPEGVVANAPYQGPAPMLPNIPVPLALPYSNDFSNVLADRSNSSPSPSTGLSKTSGGSRESRASPIPQERSAQVKPPQSKSPSVWTIAPTMRNAAVMGLSEAQLFQITGGRTLYEEACQGYDWVYDMRREAQQILPYLYLGPSTAARDRTFLRRAGITKVIAIRDSRLAMARLLVVDYMAKEMGIESECIDIPDYSALLRVLPNAVQSINRHMLAAPTDENGVSTGKVLVFCETGNVRSPPVVVAYIMSMYNMDFLDTLRYVHKRRFCVSLDEEYKHMLLSFSDLLNARRDVANDAAQVHLSDDLMRDDAQNVRESIERRHIVSHPSSRTLSPEPREARPSHLIVPTLFRPSASSSRSASRPAKRHVEETMDDEDDRAEGVSEYVQSREPSAEPGRLNLDMARYQDRLQFTPFSDKGAV
ncbi:hypothetical protein SEUCBS139899_009229 [Sporothrix eucalyptigena]|uniref:Protein-tyrosine-phosphatase n=1 Tax=Sporothrix eucalyptigena TaxID=1812306 RepID=A0ABP0D059_9PEZI